MTSKSPAELQDEVGELRNRLRKFKENQLWIVDLERQMDATLHDLGIHQEELRVQNEELVRSREKLEALLAKFSVLFEDSPVSYLVLDQRRKVLESNQAAARLLNVQKARLLGKPLTPYLKPADFDHLNHHLGRVFDGGQAMDEVELVPRTQEPVACVLRSQRIFDPNSGHPVSLSVLFDISERKRHEQQIAVLAERNRRILDAAQDGILGIGAEGLIIFSNPAVEKILQWPDVALLGRDPLEMVRPSDGQGHPIPISDFPGELTLKDGQVRSVSGQWFQRRDGSRLPVDYVVAPTFEERRVSGLVLTFRDITERHQAEAALRQVHEELEQRVRERTRELAEVNERLRLTAQVFESTSEAIVITDVSNRIVEVNPAFSLITGYSFAEASGQDPGFMKSGRHDRAFYAGMWKDIWQKGFWQGEIWDRRKTGEIYPKWLTINTVRDTAGKLRHCIGVFSDISRVKTVEEKLERLAFFDGLTGLPNRTFFKARLDHEFAAANRRRKKVALLFLDLDNFKKINDTLGHEAGDQLLTVMAQRIRSCVRDSDTVSRLGGDEFTVILPDVADAAAVSQVAGNILETIIQPLELQGHRIVAGGSLGISIYPDDGDTSDVLLKNADAAMYHAKDSGRNTFAFFTAELHAQAMRRIALESGLRHALEQDELEVHYQPKVDFSRNRVVGLEGLVRWNRCGHGLVPPGDFIPIAEESGLIRDIGQKVLEIACRQVAGLVRDGLPPLPVAINLSTRQLQQPDLLQVVQSILDQSGLPSDLLELEITESMMVEDVESTIVKLAAIRALGIRISVDDFGTGYSSLSYLKRFPIHTLKIDRSFIRDLPGDNDDAAIVRAIISMAHSLGLDTVAEGVETMAQAEFLRDHQCRSMQGFLFSRPLALPALRDYLDGMMANG
ncbi:MAG: EAL domain-containing protein [Magnetococcales bacterium]|nr:EAL domain-containing protein [Magnetococcales bacterium]